MKTTAPKLATLLIAALVLTACDDGLPSKSVVEKIISGRFYEGLRLTYKDDFIEETIQPHIKFNEVRDCKHAQNERVSCYVDLTLTMLQTEYRKKVTVEFRKTQEGEWKQL